MPRGWRNHAVDALMVALVAGLVCLFFILLGPGYQAFFNMDPAAGAWGAFAADYFLEITDSSGALLLALVGAFFILIVPTPILTIHQSLHYLKEFSIVTLTMSETKFKVDLPASSRFDATQVTTGPTLGSGAFGTVFRGDLQMNVGSGSVTTPVAVKTVKSALITEEQQRDVMVECATHMKLNHTNVVQCFGWTIPPRRIRSNHSGSVARLLRRRQTTQNGGSIRGQAIAASAGQTNHEFGQRDSLWVLVELMDGGGLDAYLAKHREDDHEDDDDESKTQTTPPGLAGTCTTLPESWRVLWAAQIASAIAYIHSQGILHRDIAARNVVLSLDSEDTGGSGVPVAKVTDFGLSRCTGQRKRDGAAVADTYYATVDATSGQLRTAIPFPWTAPECLELTETKHESQSQSSSAAAAHSSSGRSLLLRSSSRNRTRVRPTVRATPANDVWAFGVLLWEIETGGAVPFKGLKTSVMKHVRQGGRLMPPASASPILQRAMLRAWEPAESRPPMKDFLSRAEDYLRTVEPATWILPPEWEPRYSCLAGRDVLGWCLSHLSGRLAPIAGLSNLTFVNLQWSKVSGTVPADLGGQTDLAGLNLFANRFISGTLPPDLGRLTKLTRLDLGLSLKLRGRMDKIMRAITSNMTKLIDFDLSAVPEVSGTIPAQELGRLTNLRGLLLTHTSISGTLPSTVSRLVNLTWLHTQGPLSGTLPAGLNANLTKLTNLYPVGLGLGCYNDPSGFSRFCLWEHRVEFWVIIFAVFALCLFIGRRFALCMTRGALAGKEQPTTVRVPELAFKKVFPRSTRFDFAKLTFRRHLGNGAFGDVREAFYSAQEGAANHRHQQQTSFVGAKVAVKTMKRQL
eukprot:g5712.t1